MSKTQGKALISVFIWGAGFVFTKYALLAFTPVFLVFIRFGIGLVVLGSVVLLRKQFRLPNQDEYPYLIFTGFLGVTFHQWLQATGLQTASATTTAWIVSIIPVFTFILGFFFLKEHGTIINWLGIVISFFGIVWVISQGNLNSVLSKSILTRGDFLIFLSAINWAVFSIISRRGLSKYPPALMMLYIMFFGWFFSGLWLINTPIAIIIPVENIKIESVLSLLSLGIFGSGLAYIYWYDALKEIHAYQLSVFIYIEPIVTTVLAAFLINEQITLATVFGGMVTMLGIVLVNKQPSLKTKQQAST